MVLHDYKSGQEQDTQNIVKVKKPQRMFKNLSQASYKITKSFNASTTSEATFSSQRVDMRPNIVKKQQSLVSV